MKLILACLLVAFSTVAGAQDEGRESSGGGFFQGFEIAAGLDSLQVGSRFKIYHPARWYSVVGLGFSPEFLVQLNTGIANGIGMVNGSEANFIDDALANSLYIDLKVGYSFKNKDEGLFIEGGYAFMGLGGSETDYETIEDAVDTLPFTYSRATNVNITAEAQMHSLVIHMGYIWKFSQSWRATLMGGLTKPVSATADLSFDRTYVDENDMRNDIGVLDDDIASLWLFGGGFWFSYVF